MINGLPPQWQHPPKIPTLCPHDVHLWRLSIMSSAQLQAHLWTILAPDEQRRCQRFIRPQDRQRFTMVRGGLRWLLGQYLNIAAEAVQFCYGEKGKPELAQSHAVNLTFNLSHSHGMAMIALAAEGDLGIDLEQINPQADYVGITRRFLTPGEQQVVLGQPPEAQCPIFFQLWTRKEACIKAVGGSIADYLDQIDVSPGWDRPSNSIQAINVTGYKQHFYLQSLEFAPGYAGALTTSWIPRQIHQYDLDIAGVAN